MLVLRTKVEYVNPEMSSSPIQNPDSSGEGSSHGRCKISNFARTSTVMLGYRKSKSLYMDSTK